MPTEWIKIDKMPRTGGPYICAWFFIDGGIGSCCVIARSEREPHLWLCSSNDTLATDKDIAEGGFTHYAVLTLPNQ